MSYETFRFWVTVPGRARPYLTSPMTVRDAARKHPGSVAEPLTRRVEPGAREEQTEVRSSGARLGNGGALVGGPGPRERG
jgi:hypothetical protein